MKAFISLVFLLDTSSSMAANAAVYESSMKEYLEKLRDDPNADYKLTLVEFDTVSRIVCTGADLKNFKLEKYRPQGSSTNVYDAVFKATDTADEWLKSEAEKGNTYKVLFVILTDGQHNHVPSKDGQTMLGGLGWCAHTIDEVREKLTEKENTGYWTLVFLGANQDAWAVAQSIGISSGYQYQATKQGIATAGAAMAGATMSYTNAASRGVHTPSSTFWNQQDEIEEADPDKNKKKKKLDPARLP